MSPRSTVPSKTSVGTFSASISASDGTRIDGTHQSPSHLSQVEGVRCAFGNIMQDAPFLKELVYRFDPVFAADPPAVGGLNRFAGD